MKNKLKILSISFCFIFIGIVGATYAFSRMSSLFPNAFNVPTYSTVANEIFESPDDWLPGRSVDKQISITNTGDIDVVARASIVEEWKDADGDLIENNSDMEIVYKNFPNSDWIAENQTDEQGNMKTYYYYKYVLGKDEESSLLIDYVTLNEDLEIEYECIESKKNENGIILSSKCQPMISKYVGAKYTLTIKIETVQYEKDSYKDYWQTKVDITKR